MLSTRIGIAGAYFLLCVASAAAQTEAAGTTGKPLSLLQFIHKNDNAKLRPHSPTAAKFATPSAPHALASNVDRDRRKLEKPTVEARQPPAPQMPAAAAPKNVWPAADTAAPMSVLTPQPAPDPASSGAVVDRTAPDAPDAAGAPSAATPTPPAANATQSAPASPPQPPQPAAAKPLPPAPMKAARAAAPENRTLPETAKATPAVRAMAATPAHEDTGPVGSASWIAHVLAALGGAFAAGTIAWFLISPASRSLG